MSSFAQTTVIPNTQNELLLRNLTEFYSVGEKENLVKMMRIINGESNISLRILDWFVTNYSKKNFTVYDLETNDSMNHAESVRFKVYNEYKLKLKAYRKKRFDPFCRWDRIRIPYDRENYMETTIGQLNFFKWAIENRILDYIAQPDHFKAIEADMNIRNRVHNTTNRTPVGDPETNDVSATATTTMTTTTNHANTNTKTRKKREELSVSACKCIKKENVKIVVKF
jgi:hypothetical protein